MITTALWQADTPEWIAIPAAWPDMVTALRQLLAESRPKLLICGPLPWLEHSDWLLTPYLMPSMLAVAQRVVRLSQRDGLAQEAFVIAITPEFACVVAQGDREGQRGISVTFVPAGVEAALKVIQARIQSNQPDVLAVWPALMELPPPSYPVLARWGALLIAAAHSQVAVQPVAGQPLLEPGAAYTSQTPDPETQLLRALAHEIRTPLTTIRTLTRLLLRRPELDSRSRHYLEDIDRECTEQIDRFSLFFHVTELEPAKLQLQTTALTELLQLNHTRWQGQGERRGLGLQMQIHDDTASVVTAPDTLNAVLNGVWDRLCRAQPPGSEIRIEVAPAGDQIKIQFQTATTPDSEAQPLGQWLVVQTDTGALSLSMEMTRMLFKALGGRLTLRQDRGEVVTIYLPRA